MWSRSLEGGTLACLDHWQHLGAAAWAAHRDRHFAGCTRPASPLLWASSHHTHRLRGRGTSASGLPRSCRWRRLRCSAQPSRRDKGTLRQGNGSSGAWLHVPASDRGRGKLVFPHGNWRPTPPCSVKRVWASYRCTCGFWGGRCPRNAGSGRRNHLGVPVGGRGGCNLSGLKRVIMAQGTSFFFAHIAQMPGLPSCAMAIRK